MHRSVLYESRISTCTTYPGLNPLLDVSPLSRWYFYIQKYNNIIIMMAKFFFIFNIIVPEGPASIGLMSDALQNISVHMDLE